MWKKPTGTEDSPEHAERPNTAPATRAQNPQPHTPTSRARIGASLSFKGELSGEEDLLIEGKVEGRVIMRRGSVTIGEKGRVDADIEAANIQVAGSVKGDLMGTERVVLLETGRVEGNIKSKSVTLENGCRFKGSIDMESEGGTTRKESVKGAPATATKQSSPSAAVRAEA